MNTATKLGAYALGLAVVFGGAAGIGKIAGPVGATADTGGHGGHGGEKGGAQSGAPGGHGGGHGGADTGTPVPGGLQISQDGYTLVPRRTTFRPGEPTDFRFTVNGPDGRPVTGFTPLHGKRLHLIIARRDLSGFQHLHPAEVGGGVWAVQVVLPKAGTYRFFTDVQPEGAKQQLTLGADIFAEGDGRFTPLPEPEQVARVDGYEVRLSGSLAPGRTSRLVLSVGKDGEPVTDLQPYLEAYGHLVALRSGDLAYLHVHPDGEPGDGKTKAGPGITFYAKVPSAGAYRLYLDFQHAGKVRTAEFTVHAGSVPQAPPPAGEPSGGPGEGHDHTH
ncbi:hypothetical protein AGRA3207_004014 [Actinomadura graeca]|uniref:Secreted protein n=1 Tax=Actinomadura graeca TaxID=2750812 RepID=A0ABX8QW30_9ACTN|nr:hypothetical protein [Actinomadura graeca]QXJ22933.1 hypothetical protein AGRA3207_004014 [Actinomadura graeca]